MPIFQPGEAPSTAADAQNSKDLSRTHENMSLGENLGGDVGEVMLQDSGDALASP